MMGTKAPVPPPGTEEDEAATNRQIGVWIVLAGVMALACAGTWSIRGALGLGAGFCVMMAIRAISKGKTPKAYGENPYEEDG